ncbi:Flp family type IVb pilin [Streptomyces sp. NPDC090994]|uniref:Flp family type IVb pilin n=1 Tax=Streptomyces sp. NPDC090994 TaxID=3365969 RepID=UPI0037F3D652
MGNWLHTTAAYLQTRAARGDKGQTAVEYLGIIAVVVAIVLAITGTSIGQTIFDAITTKISEVTGG